MPLFDLSIITGMLLDAGADVAIKKLNRREAVISVLKRLGIDSSPDPEDFDSIYAYTLVEYGIDQTEPILNFFRNEFIHQAFRRAFYENNQALLEKEAEGIIDWNKETGQLGIINYDLRYEFANFSAIFNKIVDSLRPPAEVKRDQKLDIVYRNTEELKKGFEDFTSSQSALLMQQLTGFSNNIAIQNIELSVPDIVALRPATFLQRNELVRELQENLINTTCLALVDGSGKGKTQLAVSLFELHKEAKYWITLRNKNNLQDKHIRIQIIRWLFQLTGDFSFWQRYLLGEIAFNEIVLALGKFLGNHGVLIIDDLPNPVEVGDLYDDLEIIIKVFSECSSKVITTSQWSFPPNIENRFPSLIITCSCPPFSLDEVLILLNNIQIPTELQNEKIAALINATTKGHPILVAATINWLEKQGQGFQLETLDGLLSGEPIKDTLEYSRKVLLKTLSEGAKELLYRLSVVGEKLDKDIVFDIASVLPEINYPGEKFDEISGPWVDKLDDTHFDVSPLLAKVGQDNIPIDTQKKIHILCANRYLKNHKVNISNLLMILVHLWQAQEYTEFAALLLQGLMSTKTYEQAKYIDWACSMLSNDNWPEELDLHWRIMIRAAQLRTLALAKGNWRKINDDLSVLFAEADVNRDAPVLLFAHMALGFFAENLPLDITIPHSFSVIKILSLSPQLKEEFSIEMFDRMPEIVWASAFNIKNRSHVKLFFEELNSLDKDIRRAFSDASVAIEFASHIIDQSWFSEGEKPEEERNWPNVLSFIDDLNAMECVQESECLMVAVARSKAVVYADYLGQAEHAIKILDDLPQSKAPDNSFLVNYSKGCFASNIDHSFDASRFFNLAENTDGKGFSYYRFDTTKRLTIALEKQSDWDNAKTCCIKALRAVKESKGYDKISELELCELLGELACIHWESGKPREACGAMYGYIKELIKNKDVDNLRYKEVFNKAGHALGWFLSMARWGNPPSHALNGEEYVPVQPGLFGIQRPAIGKFVSPMGFSNSHLLRQLVHRKLS